MRAYSSLYVLDGQEKLGGMLDFAVNGYGIELANFYRMFLDCPLSICFEAGDPAVIAGRSGEELALDVLERNGYELPKRTCWQKAYQASAEYWTGWALAFYQWASGTTFKRIDAWVSIEELRALYDPYHEMDPRHFCDYLDELAQIRQPQTQLALRRLAAGLSQNQLASASGVPKRTLQQYEQRQKDVNHARADYVCALARCLCCSPADLLEHRAQVSYEYALVEI